MPPAVSALPRFMLLYASLYAGFGAASPFLPAFVSARGLPPEQIGLVLATGMAVQLISAPIAGRVADLIRNLRIVLAGFVALSALATLGYLGAYGLSAFLIISLVRAFAMAPTWVLSDALALGSTARGDDPRARSGYAWIRGSGSAAFIAGTLLAGQAIGALGLTAIIVLQALLLGGATLAVFGVPELAHPPTAAVVRAPAAGVLVLLRISRFRWLVLAAALVLGSHAMHDGFAVIRWKAAGIGPQVASVLWSESVAAEVLVFFVVGPPLLRRLSAAGAIALAAVAGALRWVVMAQSTHLLALALVQPLHGLTFALLHLACMGTLAKIVPAGLEGTAQAIYSTLGVGGSIAVFTLISGRLYGLLGAQAFWVMAAVCVAALPVAFRLRGAPGTSARVDG
jgi:PPP family 3-phenylpropionic acid transporter